MEKERFIKNNLQELIEIIKVAGYKAHWGRLTIECVNELQQRGVYCVDRFVQRLKRCTKGKDPREYWDILMEGRFAIILARNGFSKIHIEYSDKGMDIKANWNRSTIYFDVTRKRSKGDEWADLRLPDGNPESVIDKIQGKMRQLGSGEINIVVFWSSTTAALEFQMEEAFKNIENNPEMYKKLSGVLFTEDGGVSPTRLTPFQLFKNYKASNLLGTRLARKLEYLYERDPKQVKREFEELADALQRLKSSNLPTP